MNENTNWIPLLEYAVKKNVSLSTLRRYIKADRIKYRLENGRYQIWDSESAKAASSALEKELVQVKEELHKAKKEITELKTLLAFYEDAYPGGPSA